MAKKTSTNKATELFEDEEQIDDLDEAAEIIPCT
jgi:hypothetical protein